MPNARVTVTNTATNETRTVTTGDDGAYRFAGLRPGVYTMRMEAAGFQTQTTTNVNLPVATEIVTNTTLQVGHVVRITPPYVVGGIGGAGAGVHCSGAAKNAAGHKGHPEAVRKKGGPAAGGD